MEQADRRYLRRVPGDPDRVRILGFGALALGLAAQIGWFAGDTLWPVPVLAGPVMTGALVLLDNRRRVPVRPPIAHRGPALPGVRIPG